MSSEEEQPGEFDLTDPKAMRALAHPVRMALLELLRTHQTITATQASELLGETPANCAFHLRTLGKYGLVREAGGGRGRERPWRAGAARIHLRSEQADPRATMAARALGAMWRDRWFERARQGLAAAPPPGWEGAGQASQRRCYLTPEELKQIGDTVVEIVTRHDDRIDPALRPEGALPVELMFFAYPVEE
jgi:DNA-binding transcriptional ArsR family regulator